VSREESGERQPEGGAETETEGGGAETETEGGGGGGKEGKGECAELTLSSSAGGGLAPCSVSLK
jgi:hypothetical protein